ncbi:hypothetical protein CAL26_21205 [Bordetella genomosp. 9]|uniref:Toprim domain-containing protein n=1 Tax=Bordetella genomosp. 9 TaxID=1416803 RepID=A0A261R4W8_9BORD|nr:toprim domain-containing protein [Bordetella genomosp. 9]OZI20075.1 hypothetical protein CAL26_21205 [Bordetella genomosp. 9]
MLDKREWLAACQALPEGRSTRVNHSCGDGKTLRLSHEATRWRAWCFRCDEAGVEDKPVESFADRLARLKREESVDSALETVTHLPGPPEFDVSAWPAAAKVWLFKAGVGLPEIEELGAYWHEPSGRLVLPLFDPDGNLIYWQARDVTWTRASARPKYINPKVDKQYLVAKYGRGDPLVLTEDVLSAFRVGQSTEAWSLMGTSLSDGVAATIETHRPVCVWLDPDRPGLRAAREITKQLLSLGIDARRIRSRADPKLLSNREIRHHLRQPA